LQSVEADIEAQAVQEQMEQTTGSVIYGLLPWNILNPASEVARLMKLREPANHNNDNEGIEKKAA